MVIEINGKKHEVTWEYNICINGVKVKKDLDDEYILGLFSRSAKGNIITLKAKVQTETTCYIIDMESKEITFIGTAINSVKDKFIKDVGRRNSLQKAIISFDKKDKIAIFALYNNRKNTNGIKES
jgi:hypothetical protein